MRDALVALACEVSPSLYGRSPERPRSIERSGYADVGGSTACFNPRPTALDRRAATTRALPTTTEATASHRSRVIGAPVKGIDRAEAGELADGAAVDDGAWLV